MNLSIMWLALIVVLLAVEVATTSLTTIWFAGGALAALLSALLGMRMEGQGILFLGVSLLLLFLTRPLAVRYFNKKTVETNAPALVGQEAVVMERIDNLQSTGRVRIHGQEWASRAADPHGSIEKNAVVTVQKIEGVKLIVCEKKED